MTMSNPRDMDSIGTSTSTSNQDGDQLGRYRLVAALGQGGMGRIHLAVTSGLGEFRKLLVVKELQQELATNEKFVEMFLQEAKLAARLNHPNIVQTIEAGEENGRYFLSMEFLEGQPLTELLKRASAEPAVTLGTRLHILCEVLSALQYAHELCDFDGTAFEIVHRDITPHNVFVTYHGVVKLVDFGIAKAVDVESLTNAGVFKGKFAYAAPEQVRGEIVDQRSDLFAVGVMLWEAIAMRRFAPGPPTRLSVDKRLRGIEPRIVDVLPTVEPALAEICDRALHVDREQRYANAVEFRTALERYLLVSGEDPQPLAPLMTTKFAVERAAMSRMIDAYAKRGEYNQSVVRSLRTISESAAQPTGMHEEGPTRVGNLARLIESSRVDNPIGMELSPPEWSTPLRRRMNPYLWVGTGLALIGVVFFLMRLGEEPPSKAPHLTMPAPPAAPVAAPAPAVAEPAVPENVAPPQPSPADLMARDAIEKAPRVWRPRSAVTKSNASTERTGEPGESPNVGNEAAPGTTAAVTHNPYRGSDPTSISAPNGATAGVSQPSEVNLGMGQDLRALRRRAQRPIDMEDPFR